MATAFLRPWSGSRDRLGTGLSLSLLIHLSVVLLFALAPPGIVGSFRFTSENLDRQGMRVVLRGAPSAEALQGSPLDAVPDRAGAESGAADSASEKLARARVPPTPSRPNIDQYTTVETRTVVYAPRDSYAPSGSLNIRPWIANQVQPGYPEAAARRMLSGTVVIRLFISEQGSVDRTVIERADPPGLFELSTQQAFSKARYTPGVKNGKAVKSQVLIEVTFTSAAPPKVVELQGQ